MVRSRDSEAVPETRGAPVDRQRQILIRHYNRTIHSSRVSIAIIRICVYVCFSARQNQNEWNWNRNQTWHRVSSSWYLAYQLILGQKVTGLQSAKRLSSDSWLMATSVAGMTASGHENTPTFTNNAGEACHMKRIGLTDSATVSFGFSQARRSICSFF